MSSAALPGAGSVFSFGPTVFMKEMIGVATGLNTVHQGSSSEDRRAKNTADFQKVAQWGSWIKCDIPWDLVQPDADTTWNWGKIDDWIEPAISAGHNIIATIGYCPEWARPNVTWSANSPLGTTASAPSPSFYDEWATFVTAVANRYGGLNRVRHWEIWNEANRSQYWMAPNEEIYARVLYDAYNAIKTVDSGAQIITSGLASAKKPIEWSSTKSYVNAKVFSNEDYFLNTACIYEDKYYTCIVDNVNQRPPDETYWVEGASREPHIFLQDLYTELDTNSHYTSNRRPFDHVGFHAYPPYPVINIPSYTGLIHADGSSGEDFRVETTHNMFWVEAQLVRSIIVANENSSRIQSVKLINTESGIPSFSQQETVNGVSSTYFSEENQSNIIFDMLHIWFGPWKSWTGPFMIHKLRDNDTEGPDLREDNLGIYKDWSYYYSSQDDEKLVIKRLKQDSEAELVASHNFIFNLTPTASINIGLLLRANVVQPNVSASKKKYLLGINHERWIDPVAPATPVDESSLALTDEDLWENLELDLGASVLLRSVTKESSGGGAISMASALGSDFAHSPCAIDYDYDNDISLRASLLSFKVAPSDFVSVSLATYFIDWLESVPADHELYLCYWPKPEAYFTSVSGRETWKDGFKLFSGLVKSVDNPNIKTVLAFDTYLFDSRSGEIPGLWNPGAINYDIFALIGVNQYNELYTTSGGSLDPNLRWTEGSSLFTPGFERMKSLGATKFGVLYTGCHDKGVVYAPNTVGAKYNYTSSEPTAKASWITNAVDWCFQNYNMEFFCYADLNTPNTPGRYVYPEGWWIRSTTNSSIAWRDLLLKYNP